MAMTHLPDWVFSLRPRPLYQTELCLMSLHDEASSAPATIMVPRRDSSAAAPVGCVRELYISSNVFTGNVYGVGRLRKN